MIWSCSWRSRRVASSPLSRRAFSSRLKISLAVPIKSSSALDYVNLVSLRGRVGGRPVHVAGTLFGKHDKPRIVGIDEHTVDLPPASHMLVVRNNDTPGMIGRVGTLLGESGVNIADMDVGTNSAGESAIMVISAYTSVPAEVVDRIRATDGVLDAKAIELD